MARTGLLRETEIKLPLASAGQGRRLLRRAGFRVHRRRVHEQNVVFDTPDQALRSRGELLRLRNSGGRTILTFKGRATIRTHKSRVELETVVADSEMMRAILLSLGLKPHFWYEKYRTEYWLEGSPGLATLDETPIGVFLELEGEPAWIDQAAESMGFAKTSYITYSYGSLYASFRERHGGNPSRMAFQSTM
jgi:adenylate cyclase class 2